MDAWVTLNSLRPEAHRELTTVLLLGAGVLALWCLGRLKDRVRPAPSLVRTITEQSFTELLGSQGLDVRVAATTYRYLREVAGVPVPVLPGDYLIWDLGLSESQVEAAVTDLGRRLHRHLAPQPLATLPPTVEDLVLLLQGSPATLARDGVVRAA